MNPAEEEATRHLRGEAPQQEVQGEDFAYGSGQLRPKRIDPYVRPNRFPI